MYTLIVRVTSCHLNTLISKQLLAYMATVYKCTLGLKHILFQKLQLANNITVGTIILMPFTVAHT